MGSNDGRKRRQFGEQPHRAFTAALARLEPGDPNHGRLSRSLAIAALRAARLLGFRGRNGWCLRTATVVGFRAAGRDAAARLDGLLGLNQWEPECRHDLREHQHDRDCGSQGTAQGSAKAEDHR